jgi:hypothetical protein
MKRVSATGIGGLVRHFDEEAWGWNCVDSEFSRYGYFFSIGENLWTLTKTQFDFVGVAGILLVALTPPTSKRCRGLLEV